MHGNLRAEHSGWHYTADCALLEDNYRRPRLYRTSLPLARETGDRLEIGFEVQGVAMSLAGLGQPDVALRLGGAVEAEYERIGSTMHVRFWDALLTKHLGAAREALGPADAARAWAAGRACHSTRQSNRRSRRRRRADRRLPGSGSRVRRCRLDAPSSARPAS